jgi:HPt (histidine-containing phosphotransfer) domain-containing protein
MHWCTCAGQQGWKFWDSVLHNPTSLKLPQLKDAARALGLKVTGSKPELMVRLLHAFWLSAPAPAAVPARLMRVLALERTRIAGLFVFDGPLEGCDAIRSALGSMSTIRNPAGLEAWAALCGNGTGGLATARRVLEAAGISSMQQLQEAAQQARQQLANETPEQRRVREAAEQADQQAELQQLVREVEEERQAKREKEQLAGQLYRQYTAGGALPALPVLPVLPAAAGSRGFV